MSEDVEAKFKAHRILLQLLVASVPDGWNTLRKAVSDEFDQRPEVKAELLRILDEDQLTTP